MHRCFCFVRSDTANRHALRSLARVGAGAFEFFERKAKSKWEGRVKSQLSKASQPSLSNIEVAWQQFSENDAAKLVQAPANIMALFNGCRQVVYGFVANCTQVKSSFILDCSLSHTYTLLIRMHTRTHKLVRVATVYCG